MFAPAPAVWRHSQSAHHGFPFASVSFRPRRGRRAGVAAFGEKEETGSRAVQLVAISQAGVGEDAAAGAGGRYRIAAGPVPAGGVAGARAGEAGIEFAPVRFRLGMAAG